MAGDYITRKAERRSETGCIAGFVYPTSERVICRDVLVSFRPVSAEERASRGEAASAILGRVETRPSGARDPLREPFKPTEEVPFQQLSDPISVRFF